MSRRSFAAPQVWLIAVLFVAAVLGARDITSESSGVLGFDMARYLMDGVFIHDLIAMGGAWSPSELADTAERYYAQYPALSIGHHPPLPYVALVPFYAVFGVSVFAARLAALTWFVLATWGVYALARRLLGAQAAPWAALLFVTNLMVLRAGQYVVSEMPMLALILAAANALLSYCERRRPRDLAWFALAAVASLYAKQLAILMLPVYLVIFVTRLGWRALAVRHVLVLIGLALIAAVPLVVMTLTMSRANVSLMAYNIAGLTSGASRMEPGGIFRRILSNHLDTPMMIAAAAGAVMLLIQRRREAGLILLWVLAIIGGTFVFTAGFEPARYAFAALPAYFLLAAGLATPPLRSAAGVAGIVVLAVALGWQAWTVRDVRPTGAGGYEEAAQFVVKESRHPVVLFDSRHDTGYFVFFVRKHDPEGRLVVARADKLMTAPRTDKGSPSKFDTPDQIFEVIRQMGVQYVVVEERTRGPAALRLLHELLKTDAFVERQRILIDSRQPEAAGIHLVVYEYRDAQPPNLDAPLQIELPLGNRAIKLTLRDVLKLR